MEKNYFILPFYKKWLIKIKKKLKEKKENFKFPFLKVGIFVCICLLITGIVILVISNKRVFPTHASYDKTGFVMYDDLEQTTFTLTNTNYQFVLDCKDTHFTLTNQLTGVTFKSNPTESNKIDTLTVYYAGSLGTPVKYGNYQHSINNEGFHRYAFRETEETIEVLYYLGGKVKIDYTDLPALISKERYENNILKKAQSYVDHLNEIGDSNYRTYRSYLSYLKASYKPNEQYGYYALENGSALSSLYINGIYEIFYNVCGYTAEDLEQDNRENGVESQKKYPTFEVSIRYHLTNDGLEVELINESLVDFETHPLIYIDLLPYFGCGNKNDQGYSLIPDGSGALLDFNNGREYASSYEQRIYGEDLAKNDSIMKKDKSQIAFGLYGMQVNNEGFLHIIDNGASLCSVVASMNSAKTLEAYNQTYYRIYYRETDLYRFESLAGLSDIQTWTNEYNKESVKTLIQIIDSPADYNVMAQSYRKYLLQKGVLIEKANNHLSLDLTLIGGYLEEKNFIGLNYSKTSPLSAINDVSTLMENLHKDQVEHLNLIYEGFSKGGIKANYGLQFKYEQSITSQKKLKEFNEKIEKLGFILYPSYRIGTIYINKGIADKNLVRNQYGNIVVSYPNNEASLLQNKEYTPKYYLKPSTYTNTFNKIQKVLSKNHISQVMISDIGSMMYGTYQRKDFSFRSDMQKELVNSLKIFVDSHQIALRKPNEYLLKYTSLLLDIPSNCTNYAIVKCNVPFYQLVISGCLDYSLPSFNLDDSNSLDYLKLKTIETLGNISMTWTIEKTDCLIGTEYDYFYSTYYQNWYQETIEMYNELRKLGIYNTHLVSHHFLDDSEQHILVKYSSGQEIVINYGKEIYQYDNGEIYLINPQKYCLVKRGY